MGNRDSTNLAPDRTQRLGKFPSSHLHPLLNITPTDNCAPRNATVGGLLSSTDILILPDGTRVQ